MKFKLKFSILLVLSLSLAYCADTVCSFNYEDSPEVNDPITEKTPTNNNTEETAGDGTNSQTQEKRVIGMPVATRDLSSAPIQVGDTRQDLPQGQVTSVISSYSQPDIVQQPLQPNGEQLQQPNNQPESSARGFSSEIMSALLQAPQQQQLQQQQQILQQQPQQQQSQQQSQQQQQQLSQQQQQLPQPQIQNVSPARQEDLPRIIENNKQVDPNQQNNGGPVLELPTPQNPPPVPTSLVSPSAAAPLAMSTARTFDGWTNCVGSEGGKYGTCKNDVECNKNKGRPDGSCMGGLGVCCVMALSCGEKSLENNTFFANPDYPEPSWEARLCEVELKKKHKGILQIMIEFEDFELAPPNIEGECITDVFQIKLSSNKPSPYSLLRICGQNTGQHLYLDVSQIDEPLLLSVATSGGGYPRRWSIRIVQMDEKNYLLAPPGCLQYYTDTVGHFRSFNLGRSLKHLYYAVCFRIDNGYSGIRFTENFFGMNGPGCKRKPGGGSSMIGGSRYNNTFGAHPHHLVIPPQGYGPPPPRPKFRGGGHGFKRLKRDDSRSERAKRTSSEHEHEKEFKLEEKEHKNYGGYSQPGYGGHVPPSYYPPQHSIPPPVYGPGYKPVYTQQPYYYDPKKVEYKEEYKEEFKEKFGEKEHEKWAKNEHEKHFKEQEKLLKEHEKHSKEHSMFEHEQSKHWWNNFGWAGKEELKDEKKYPHHGAYYPPSYGQSPVPYSSYGPQIHQPGPHQHSAYGNYGGYGGFKGGPVYSPPSYGGDYHHKEIDKFGKKYEHLEYKHEKNHFHEHEKSSSGGWWPWGKKEEKKDKKEKYNQHHEALFPMMHIPEMPHCEPRFCGQNDVITFPPSGDSISEMCGNRFNRGRGPKIISGSPLVVYVSNRGHQRGAGFDINYEQVFYIPRPYQ